MKHLLKKNSILAIIFIAFLSSSFQQKTNNPPQSISTEYDLVILNGRVMDPETMFDDVANVGVIDGKIVAITKSLKNCSFCSIRLRNISIGATRSWTLVTG